MTATRRIYLDNAATSWPKPESVYSAVERYMRDVGAAAGRGAYADADRARQVVQQARRAVGRVVNADPRQIVFTKNGTEALNLAIYGLLRHRPGRVVTTDAEHNSVLRPLRQLEKQGLASVQFVGCDRAGLVDVSEVAAALTADTRLLVVNHVSNVTGVIQPLEAIMPRAKALGVPVLVDAAQSLGEVPIDVQQLGIDLLAAPGHKGLLGPLGTGVLYLRPGFEAQVDSLVQGGTGSFSEEEQPDTLPDKYEAGNLNVPALAGLAAGCEFVLAHGVVALGNRVRQLGRRLVERLRKIPGVELFSPENEVQHVGIVSLVARDWPPQELAAALDSAYGVQVRAGLHCAPRLHANLGTMASGGAVRFSPGPLTTDEEIDRAADAVAAIVTA